MNKIFYCILIIILSACAADTMDRLKNVGKPPAFEKLEIPGNNQNYFERNNIKNDLIDYPNIEPVKQPEKKLTNSLWQDGARTFFSDQRARRIGDILKVSINIKDSANWSNNTAQTRNNNESAKAPNLLGFEQKLKNVIKGVDPTNLLSLSGNRDSSGKGTIDRQEAVQTQFSAMVTHIYPNGNLHIKGHQEVRVNFELREMTIEGVVRPSDITSDNMISSDQIAEARISYGGRGNITNLQQPKLGNQVIDIISPF